jgi:hypothetical protein
VERNQRVLMAQGMALTKHPTNEHQTNPVITNSMEK